MMSEDEMYAKEENYPDTKKMIGARGKGAGKGDEDVDEERFALL